MSYIKRKLIVLFSLLIFLTPSFLQASGLSFRVDKSKVKLIVQKKDSSVGEIKVYSQADEPMKIKAYLEDWVYTKEQDGSKDFFPLGSTANSCSQWIKFSPAEFTLSPYGVTSVNYVITPSAEASGGHYAVMFFESLPEPVSIETFGKEEVRSGIGIAIRLGTLFYVEVKDTVKRAVELSNFSVSKDTQSNYYFISSEIKNSGNTYITTSASFHIMDRQGLVLGRGEFNNVYTFQGDSAKINAAWKELLPKGKHSIVLTLDLGKAQEEAKIGRGPVVVKEVELEIGEKGEVIRVGELK